MVMTGTLRQLPPVPNPDNLRKQAKTRLVALRAHASSTRLADAQHLIAREYGFANWAALQAEVARRQQSPLACYALIRRISRPAPHQRDLEETPLASNSMLGAAATASIFFVMAGIGGGMVYLLNRTQLDRLYALHDAATLLHKFL
jgi:hypothetical protein